MPQGNSCDCGDNRESGESPERSGHCNQGVESSETIGILLRRMDSVLICKSGNLLCMHRVDASDESFHSKTIMGYGMSENFRLDF